LDADLLSAGNKSYAVMQLCSCAVMQLRNNIFFDEDGFYDGPGIIWHGEMAKQGIVDLLPYDYKP